MYGQEVIYLSGSVSKHIKKEGYNSCHCKFLIAKARAQYHFRMARIVNQMDLCNPSWGWFKCMKVCLSKLYHCTHIYMLSDWRRSTGARIERFFAKIWKIKIIEGID